MYYAKPFFDYGIIASLGWRDWGRSSSGCSMLSSGCSMLSSGCSMLADHHNRVLVHRVGHEMNATQNAEAAGHKHALRVVNGGQILVACCAKVFVRQCEIGLSKGEKRRKKKKRKKNGRDRELGRENVTNPSGKS
jgi:hypothetical protein